MTITTATDYQYQGRVDMADCKSWRVEKAAQSNHFATDRPLGDLSE